MFSSKTDSPAQGLGSAVSSPAGPQKSSKNDQIMVFITADC